MSFPSHFDRHVYIAQNIIRLLSNECVETGTIHGPLYTEQENAFIFHTGKMHYLFILDDGCVDECVRISQSTTLDCNLYTHVA